MGIRTTAMSLGVRVVRSVRFRSRKAFVKWRRLAISEYTRRTQTEIDVRGMRVPIGPHMGPAVLESLARGTYEGPELDFLKRYLRPGDRVLELGAGLGLTSAFCARIVGSDRVDTYEANPSLRKHIEAIYELNGVQPKLHTEVLGRDAEPVEFHIEPEFWSSSTVKRSNAGRLVSVPGRRFNDVINDVQPTFVIIDIEGGEVELFKHARLDGVEKLLIELHPHVVGQRAVDDVLATLEEQGFSPLEAGKDEQVVYLTRQELH